MRVINWLRGLCLDKADEIQITITNVESYRDAYWPPGSIGYEQLTLTVKFLTLRMTIWQALGGQT